MKQEQALKAFDYIFFFNANAEFMQPVTREMLLPRAEKGEHLLVVQHPSFYAKPNYEFTYDRNPRSTACIPYGLGKYYVCGGVNGGTTPAFWSCAARWTSAFAGTCSTTSLHCGTMNPRSTA